jgi:hypothetical protein
MEQDDGTWIVTGCDHKCPYLCMHQDTSFKPPALLICSISLILFEPPSSYPSPTFYHLIYFLSKMARSQYANFALFTDFCSSPSNKFL